MVNGTPQFFLVLIVNILKGTLHELNHNFKVLRLYFFMLQN